METRGEKFFIERVEVPEAQKDSVVEFVGKKLRSPGSKSRLVTDIEVGRCGHQGRLISSGGISIDVICRKFTSSLICS